MTLGVPQHCPLMRPLCPQDVDFGYKVISKQNFEEFCESSQIRVVVWENFTIGENQF